MRFFKFNDNEWSQSQLFLCDAALCLFVYYFHSFIAIALVFILHSAPALGFHALLLLHNIYMVFLFSSQSGLQGNFVDWRVVKNAALPRGPTGTFIWLGCVSVNIVANFSGNAVLSRRQCCISCLTPAATTEGGQPPPSLRLMVKQKSF